MSMDSQIANLAWKIIFN